MTNASSLLPPPPGRTVNGSVGPALSLRSVPWDLGIEVSLSIVEGCVTLAFSFPSDLIRENSTTLSSSYAKDGGADLRPSPYLSPPSLVEDRRMEAEQVEGRLDEGTGRVTILCFFFRWTRGQVGPNAP